MKNNDEESKLIDLSILSTVIFIIGTIVSLTITIDEKTNINNKKRFYTTKQALDLSFYNRIVILITVLISLYVGYNNYKNEKEDTRGKYKSSLLLTTNVLTLVSAIIILYVSYLNKQEQSLTASDVENPLI